MDPIQVCRTKKTQNSPVKSETQKIPKTQNLPEFLLEEPKILIFIRILKIYLKK